MTKLIWTDDDLCWDVGILSVLKVSWKRNRTMSLRLPDCVCKPFSFGFTSIVVSSLSAKTRHHKVPPAPFGLVSTLASSFAWCYSQFQIFFFFSVDVQFPVGFHFMCVRSFLSRPFMCIRRQTERFLCQDIFGHWWFFQSCFFSLGPLRLASVRTHGLSRLSSWSATVAISSLTFPPPFLFIFFYFCIFF